MAAFMLGADGISIAEAWRGAGGLAEALIGTAIGVIHPGSSILDICGQAGLTSYSSWPLSFESEPRVIETSSYVPDATGSLEVYSAPDTRQHILPNVLRRVLYC